MENIRTILEKLKNDKSELDWIEVKSAKKGIPEKLYKTLSALTNKEGGGYILFGVSDAPHFKVEGIENLDKLQSVLSNVARNEMHPPIDIRFTAQNVGNATLLLTYVTETLYNLKPCYYKPSGILKGSYIRIGDGDRRLTEYEIVLLISNVKRVLDDSLEIEEAKEFIGSEAIQKYIALLKEKYPNASFLKGDEAKVKERLGLIKNTSPTLASIVCLSPYPQQYCPALTVHFLQPALEKEHVRYLDNKKFEGNIPEMINETVKYILSKLARRTIIIGNDRKDRYEIPEEALREIIRNALIHRDYSPRALGTPIQIYMYNDRIEFINPGGLYGPVSVRNIAQSMSTRNSLIVKILESLEVVENRGGGIDEIVRSVEKYGLVSPKFYNEISFFKVVLSRKDENESEEKTIYSFLAKQKVFSRKNVMEYFSVSRTYATEFYIAKMLGLKLIKQEGKGRGTKYFRV